ncbi:MAG TPA: SDR family oxidoreductase [Xanthobacteraceae bacterium]
MTSFDSINVSGVGGHGRGAPAYASSKAAIIGLARALARSLTPLNIRVNAVSPGNGNDGRIRRGGFAHGCRTYPDWPRRRKANPPPPPLCVSTKPYRPFGLR